MTTKPEDDDMIAFRRVRWVHIGFMVVALVLVQTALQIDVPDEFPQLGGQSLWLVRAGLATLWIVSLATLNSVLIKTKPGQSSPPAFFEKCSPATQIAISKAFLRMAFSESAGVYGLLIFLLGGHLLDVFAFGAAAMVALAWFYPTRARWDREVEQANRELAQ